MDEYDPIKFIREINTAQQKVNSRIYDCFAGMDLNATQSIILYHIIVEEKSKTVYLKDIAKSFGISSAAVSQMLKQVKKQGYIVDARENDDARFRKITTTQKAKNSERELKQRIDRFSDFLKERYSEDELERMYGFMEKI